MVEVTQGAFVPSYFQNDRVAFDKNFIMISLYTVSIK